MKTRLLGMLGALAIFVAPLRAQISLGNYQLYEWSASGGHGATVNGLDVSASWRDMSDTMKVLEMAASNDRVYIQHRWKNVFPGTTLIAGAGSFRNTPWVHGMIVLNPGGCLKLTQWSGISTGKIGEDGWNPQLFMHMSSVSCTVQGMTAAYSILRVQDGPWREFVGLNLVGKLNPHATLTVSPEYEIDSGKPLLRVVLRFKL